MKKYVFTILLSVVLIISGSILASLPKLTLKCDGANCVLYRNLFGQIIQVKYKFAYQDVQRCEVKPVTKLGPNGELNTVNFTLRLMGPEIKYTPEWQDKKPSKLSNVCNCFFRSQPFKYSDNTFLNFLKSIWFIFIFLGGYLIAIAKKKEDLI